MKDQFTKQLQVFNAWKSAVSEQIERYRLWLESHDMSSPEDDLRLFDAIEALKTDQLTVAVAAEFSRGKTELLNAIFFSGYERRLLPSAAGRTTMCPTELFFDKSSADSYIRLLPIETRMESTTIMEYRQQKEHWTNINLDVNSPDSMVECFQEIARTKSVDVEKAIRLGLYVKDPNQPESSVPTSVEIPMWRHVLINFPHPLLKQGLVVLDTPGLNAMGSEPELTLEMLPKAQAIIFVLAADTGATKSDMEIWQHSGKLYMEQKHTGVLVVMNKIDTLWDELHDDAAITKNIQVQRDSIAETFGINRDVVFPISAQKGLLAKIKKDDELLVKSGLPLLEANLSNHVLPARQVIVRENIVSKIGGMVTTTENLLKSRYHNIQQQLEELQSMAGKNTEVLNETMKKLRAEQTVYQKDVENFQTSRHVLKRQFIALSESLALESLDGMIGSTREDMVDSWTTTGMKRSMKEFFDRSQEVMVQINWQVEKANKLVVSIYQRFQKEHGFSKIKPELFSTAKYSAELKTLLLEAAQYRKSPTMTMSEQSYVVKRFFVSMVSHARNVFFKVNEEAEKWSKNAMSPLGKEIKERKSHLEKRLNTLQSVKSSKEKMAESIEELNKDKQDLVAQLKTITTILTAIKTPLPNDEEKNKNNDLKKKSA